MPRGGQRPDSPSAGLLHGAAPRELALRSGGFCPVPLPASQCVCPATGESAAGPEGPPWDLGSDSPAAQAGSGAAPSQSDHVGAALPSASSATKRCARRSRGPAEGCVGRCRGFPRRRRLPSSPASSAATRGVQSLGWAACPHSAPPPGPGAPLGAFLPSGCLDNVSRPSSLRDHCTIHPEVQPPRDPGEDRVPRLQQGKGRVTPETSGPAAPAWFSPFHPRSARRPGGPARGQRLQEPGAPLFLLP